MSSVFELDETITPEFLKENGYHWCMLHRHYTKRVYTLGEDYVILAQMWNYSRMQYVELIITPSEDVEGRYYVTLEQKYINQMPFKYSLREIREKIDLSVMEQRVKTSLEKIKDMDPKGFKI